MATALLPCSRPEEASFDSSKIVFSAPPPPEEEEYNLLLEGISIDLVTNGLLPVIPLIVSINLVSSPTSDLEVVLAAGFDEADVGRTGSV